MNRTDLVRALLARTDLTVAEAEWLVCLFFDELARGIAQYGHVEIRGFGVFRVNSRQQAGFINPKNGQYYPAQTVKTIKFYPSSSVDVD
ncbi:MAG: HU family DNA-binding protein [Acidobacteria bacterium]|nr:HU family DNA-binding protein [Acidobacteriota bacterium]